jgi:HAD superfamily hydrolase (TIGR01509 family)
VNGHLPPEPVDPVRDRVVLRRSLIDAAVFDVDGVLTDTTAVHQEAWIRTFAELRQATAHAAASPAMVFGPAEYRSLVDGRPRLDGVRAALDALRIDLPDGTPHDPPGFGSAHAIAAWKQRAYRERLSEVGARALPGIVDLLARLRAAAIAIAAVSSSENARAVLEAADLTRRVDTVIDGVDARRHGLAGKPDPAVYLAAAEALHADVTRAALFEDSVAGVQAARRGRFGLVVAIAGADRSEQLRRAGAHVVVPGLVAVVVRP